MEKSSQEMAPPKLSGFSNQHSFDKKFLKIDASVYCDALVSTEAY